MMLDYDAIGKYVLVLTLATLLVMVLLVRQHRSKKDLPIWLMAGLIGILLGAAGLAAVMHLSGYTLAMAYAQPQADGAATPAPTGSGSTGSGSMGSGSTGTTMGGPGGMGGMGMGGMGGPGMGGPGMGGPGMGGPGGGRGPNPKRDLTTLVRKVDLLTGDIALKLSDKQAVGVVGVLDRIRAKEKMTDDEAKALHEELTALFDDAQTAKQDAIGLPVRRGGAGGGPGGGPGGQGGGAPGGPGGGPGAGAQADPEENPFKQDQNASAVKSLLERFARPAADKATADQPSGTKPAP